MSTSSPISPSLQKGPGLTRTPLPRGFSTSGINSGVRKYRPDLGLIFSEAPATTVGVFTLNELKAAPIRYSEKLLPSQSVRAIITNSGQANAATGASGIQDNLAMVHKASEVLGCDPDEILTASTGVIGQPLALDKINAAMGELYQRRTNNAEAFALAILTTDLVPKTATIEVALLKGVVRITGICKGSGMIHPNMGTMLGYILTDAVLPVEKAQTLLKRTVDVTFNMISVDGDCSTNDCVFLMANGCSEISLSTPDDESLFEQAVLSVMQTLAQSIARDGEGATKLIEVSLKGLPSLELARQAARGVTLSPLVKTAIHGEDPNWGRIVARLGAEKIPSLALDKMNLFIQGTLVFSQNTTIEFDRQALKRELQKDTVIIEADFFSGQESATAWGCDLSKKYIEINTEYS